MGNRKKFAIPTVNKQLTPHFGRCEQFAIVETEDNRITKVEYMLPPVHEPGVYPRFLMENDVDVIIVGGIGHKAQNLFARHDIEVYMGVNPDSPEKLVEDYLNNRLQTSRNPCDH